MSFRKPCHMPFRKLIPPFTLIENLLSYGKITDGFAVFNKNNLHPNKYWAEYPYKTNNW